MHENRHAWRQEHDRVSGVDKETRVIWSHQWGTSVLSRSNHQSPGKAGNAVAQAVEDNHGGSQLTVDHTEMITITIFQSSSVLFWLCLWVATGLKYVETMAIARRISTFKCQPSKRMMKKNYLGRSSVLGPPGSASFSFLLRAPLEKGLFACHGFGKRLPVTR